MEVLQKLKINTGAPLWLINVPERCEYIFDGIELIRKPSKKQTIIQVVLFAENSETLNHYFHNIIPFISDETLLWVCHPKKSGSIKSDLVRNEGWDDVFKAGYHGVTEAAIDADWTGFRIKKRNKITTFIRDVPMAERKIPCIDFTTRTAQLPPDALAELAQYPGTTDFFNSLAFSHKKEHIIAIEDAKKEATRISRIQRMAAMLQQQMLAKTMKKK